MSDSQVIRTDAAPAPAHTFSQGIRKGGMLQVSGQGPMDPETNKYIGEGDVRAQTRRTLENVKAILAAGGAGVEDVLMFRVYLTKREDFAAMNEVYGEFIAENVKSDQPVPDNGIRGPPARGDAGGDRRARGRGLAQQAPRHVGDLHLVASGVDHQRLGITRQLFDPVLGHVAVAAEQLDRVHRDIGGGLRAVPLDRRRLWQ